MSVTYSREFVRIQPVADSVKLPRASSKYMGDYLRKKLLGAHRPDSRLVSVLNQMTDAELVEEYRLHEEEKHIKVTIVRRQQLSVVK